MTNTTTKRWGMMSLLEQVETDYARAKAEAKNYTERQDVERCRQKIAAKAKANAAPVAKSATPVAVHAVRRACSYCGRLAVVGSLCCGDEV